MQFVFRPLGTPLLTPLHSKQKHKICSFQICYSFTGNGVLFLNHYVCILKDFAITYAYKIKSLEILLKFYFVIDYIYLIISSFVL